MILDDIPETAPEASFEDTAKLATEVYNKLKVAHFLATIANDSRKIIETAEALHTLSKLMRALHIPIPKEGTDDGN